MANKRQIKANELKGINIYQDPKYGTVYYDWLTRKGYRINNIDTKWYNFSSFFLPVAIVTAYGCYAILKFYLLPSIIIAALAYVIMKMIYRFKFINTLPVIENYKRPDNGNIFKNAASTYNKTRLVILLILAVALVAVTLVYLFVEKPVGNERLGIYALVVASVGMLLFSIITLLVQNKK